MTSKTMLVILSLVLLLCVAVAGLHAQTFNDLYDFNCGTGGCSPYGYGALTQGSDGNLYGINSQGGTYGYGTIFMVTPSGAYTDLYQFDGVQGANPAGGLALASDGNLYGTTTAGGTYGWGTVFRFTPPSTLAVLDSFNGNSPYAAPVQAKDGNLYGVTVGGGTSPGPAYRVTLPAGTVKLLSSLPGLTFVPMIVASDGNLYGTSISGGTYGLGTVFRMTTTGAIKVIHNFIGTSTDGSTPDGPLTQARDGNLYGIAAFGGASNSGVAFKMSLTGKINVLHSFDYNTDGAPRAGLLAAPDGFLYAPTLLGGADGYGTLFLITTGGFFNKLFDFTGTAGAVPGYLAQTTLVAHSNGTFYGLTDGGGASAAGNFYSLTPANPILTLLVEGPIFLLPGGPVEILGNNLTQVAELTFAGEQTQFQAGSDTYLIAQVPNDAVDGFVTASLDSGLQIETQSAIHILPMITNLDPSSGPVGTQVGIVGGGFAGATKVTFGGVKAANFTVASPSLIQAIVPTGAKTGKVTVTTPNGTATSKQKFIVN